MQGAPAPVVVWVRKLPEFCRVAAIALEPAYGLESAPMSPLISELKACIISWFCNRSDSNQHPAAAIPGNPQGNSAVPDPRVPLLARQGQVDIKPSVDGLRGYSKTGLNKATTFFWLPHALTSSLGAGPLRERLRLWSCSAGRSGASTWSSRELKSPVMRPGLLPLRGSSAAALYSYSGRVRSYSVFGRV